MTAVPGSRFRGGEHIIPRGVGHLDVGKDQVVLGRLDHLHGLRTVMGNIHYRPAAGQHIPNRLADELLIIGHQYALAEDQGVGGLADGHRAHEAARGLSLDFFQKVLGLLHAIGDPREAFTRNAAASGSPHGSLERNASTSALMSASGPVSRSRTAAAISVVAL